WRGGGGCSGGAATLEPMAAYFSRIVESDETFLPKELFPLSTGGTTCNGPGPHPASCSCKVGVNGKLTTACLAFFDPAFSDTNHAVLPGAYPAPPGGGTAPRAPGPAGPTV